MKEQKSRVSCNGNDIYGRKITASLLKKLKGFVDKKEECVYNGNTNIFRRK